MRQVLCAVYRLLRSMVDDFPLTQSDLVKEMPLIVAHIGKLVAYDISPTECMLLATDATSRSASDWGGGPLFFNMLIDSITILTGIFFWQKS